MGNILLLLGALACLYGFIVILINAFKTSVLWGLGSLFVPFVILIFAIMNWEQNKKPFLIYLAGAVLIGIGYAMVLPGMMEQAQAQ